MAIYRTKPQPIGNILEQLIDQMGIRSRMDKAQIIESWAILAGDHINAVTRSVWLKNDQLFVQLNSSVWRHELHLHRQQWTERLNEALGKQVIREIVFR